ncbi:putative ubiquitin carboxyl-terminal hydrolase 28 [Encephalitozoon intestinalis]
MNLKIYILRIGLMRTKPESCVFFLNEMTAEEEYNIVTRQPPRLPKRPVGRLNGNKILLSGNKLFVERHIEVVDLEYVESDEKIFNLLICLVRLPPFYNFILNFREKGEDIEKCQIMFRISEFLRLLMEEKKTNASDLLMESDSKVYEDIYSELLQAIHDELCEYYNFEEDTWSTMGKTQGAKPKLLYKEYSPIVEIFQGKAVSGSQSQEISFEKSRVSLKGFSNIQEAFDSSLKVKNRKITKKPPVLVLVVKEQGGIDILNGSNISLGSHTFSLCSFITEENTMSYCYVKDGEGWHGYGAGGVEKILEMKDVCGYPLMLFYTCNE